MPNLDTQSLLEILVGVAAFAVLLQALILLGILITLIIVARIAKKKADDLVPVLQKSHAILESTQGVLHRLEPRFDQAASDISEVVKTARNQAGRFDQAATDLQDRLHKHTVRIDGLATSVLDFVENTGNSVVETINRPRRQASGVVAAARAFVKGYAAPVGNAAPQRPATAEDKNTPA